MTRSPKISAVIRTYNSGNTLRQMLSSLQMQTQALHELVVVDSGSTDDTRDIANKFGCHWIDNISRPFNYARALNIGITASDGDPVLIMSSHTIFLYEDILQLMIKNLEYYGAAGASCGTTKDPNAAPRVTDPNRFRRVAVIRGEMFDGYNGLSNTCSLVRRTCWERHHFDESMPTAEDQEWAQWFYRNSDMPTVVIPNAGVLYVNPNYSLRKEVREYGVIASRLLPTKASGFAIAKLFVRSLMLASIGRFAPSKMSLLYGVELLKVRLLRAFE